MQQLQQSPKLRRLLQRVAHWETLTRRNCPCPQQGINLHQSTFGKPSSFVSADGSIIFPCPITEKQHISGPPPSWTSPLLLQLEVPHWVEAHAAADVMSVVVDTVDTGVHHLGSYGWPWGWGFPCWRQWQYSTFSTGGCVPTDGTAPDEPPSLQCHEKKHKLEHVLFMRL
jgi:hypothetical protein